MTEIRIVFNAPQQFGPATLTEVTVAADRLLGEGENLLAVSAGEITLTVPWTVVAEVELPTGSGRVPSAAVRRNRQKHPNHGKSWSAEDKALLARLWDEGEKEIPKLMEQFGRSRSAITSKLMELGRIQLEGTPQQQERDQDEAAGAHAPSPEPGTQG